MAEITPDLSDIELQNVSDRLGPDEWKRLGRRLGVDNLDQLKYDYKDDGLAEIVFQMLYRWRMRYGEEATKKRLVIALNETGRPDIVTELCAGSELGLCEMAEKGTPKLREIKNRICDKQRRCYRSVKLPQVPWMKKILPLEDLYVELEMVKFHENEDTMSAIPMKLKEMFEKVDDEEPVRILVEGGPGFGKSTLCLKLLNDWARNRDYIGSKFEMVFLFQLRYCIEKHSIQELLSNEFATAGVDVHEANQCIPAFESKTLLILDGFDELNEECKRQFLPLIQRKEFRSMYVVVTSRKGMFQLQKKSKKPPAGILETIDGDLDTVELWNKRLLIKGVTEDKVERFMQKYFETNFEELKPKFISVTKGFLSQVLECPLFLVLLATMLEDKKIENVDSKTSLYKEFFNFITRRNLIREKKIDEEQKIDLFNESSYQPVIESLVRFGQLAVDYLCENKLIFEEEKILERCNDKIVLHLGFLVKLTKIQNHQTDDFYQPVHKSFLEFVAAFAIWKLSNTDQNQFKRELERIGDKGLKPSDDSLFYVFLGGLMNSKAHILFQCLSPYYLWFNIENFCFTNILLEIRDVDSFFSSFEPLLKPFIPSVYHININYKGNTDLFDSRIHSFLLRYASDRHLIKYLYWDFSFSFNSPQDLYIETLDLKVDQHISRRFPNESKFIFRCKHVIVSFYYSRKADNWKDFITLMNLIKSETYHFDFSRVGDNFISSLFFSFYKEMSEGQWKQKNIDQFRLRVKMDDDKDVDSVSLLVDLVVKNRIKEGISLEIDDRSIGLTEDKKNLFNKKVQEFIDAVIDSKSIVELSLYFYGYSPRFHFNRANLKKWKWLRFNLGSLSFLNLREKISIEEIRIQPFDDEKTLHLIENIEGVKGLSCSLTNFKSLIDMKCSHFNGIEELELRCIDCEKDFLPLIYRFCLHLNNLQILSLYVRDISCVPSESSNSFVNLFACLNLRICQFLGVGNVSVFSFFTEVLMEGLNKKEEKGTSSVDGDKNDSTVESTKKSKIHLHELFIWFDLFVEADSSQLEELKGIEWIRSMLRLKRLGKFSWVDNFFYDDPSVYLSWFQLNEKFRISREVEGRSSTSSRLSQVKYHWGLTTANVYSVEFNGS